MIPPSASRARPAPENRVARPGLRWRWLVGLIAIIALVAAMRYFRVQEGLRPALDWMGTLGPWGPVIFAAIYALAAIFLVPGSVLTVGAGAVFGLSRGIAIVSIASTLGATGAFLIGRHLARDVVARRLERHPNFAAIDRAVAAEGWKIVLLTRLSPVFPYTLLNYAFSLTGVRLIHYVLASWIGMLPGAVMYVYLGTLARTGADPSLRTSGGRVVYGAGLLATILVTALVTRIARRALARRLDGNAPAHAGSPDPDEPRSLMRE